jgi:primosomal protein N'
MGQNLSILLYSSQKQASVGDIVEISIRNNLDYGLILSENIEEMNKYKVEAASVSPQETQKVSNPQKPQSLRDSPLSRGNLVIGNKITKSEVKTKKFEIKEINKILPIKLSHEQIQFLKIFSDNTFNSLNDTWDAISQSYNLLTQKQWKELQGMADLKDKTILNQFEGNISQAVTSSDKNQKDQNDTFIEAENSENRKKNEVFTNKSLTASKVEFIIDFNIIVRIMYIIRSLMDNMREEQKDLKQAINRQLLIVFPEKKYLNKVYKYIFNEISRSKELSEIVEILYYASEPTKKPKECIWSMLNFKNNLKTVTATTVSPQETQDISNPPDRIFRSNQYDVNSQSSKTQPDRILNQVQNDNSNNNTNQTSLKVNNYTTPRLQIILSTRSGLFLPFTTLTDIILVDEGNSMYIQDQNSLYYDTREAIFLIAKAFNANISFISPLPSIRLYNMYDKQALEKEMNTNQAIAQKPRKIKITRFDKKSSKYDLFGYEIEQMLS